MVEGACAIHADCVKAQDLIHDMVGPSKTALYWPKPGLRVCRSGRPLRYGGICSLREHGEDFLDETLPANPPLLLKKLILGVTSLGHFPQVRVLVLHRWRENHRIVVVRSHR